MVIPLATSLILIIMILVAVAFLTLMERKILGSIQIRIGPNKVGLEGILQPFSDAMKLYSKEKNLPMKSSKKIFFLSPMLGLSIALLTWVIVPYMKPMYMINLGLMAYMSLLGMGVYILMLEGWSSNSAYALIGAMRCVAQTISYEVTMIFIILSMFTLNESMSFYSFSENQTYLWFMFLIPNFLMWIMVMLAELNRTPFDFGEGESELVSGFNVEYSGPGFAMIFMTEYAMILLAGIMTTVMFLGADFYSFFFYLKSSLISFSIIWIRGTLPRFRYDKLMYFTWKKLLPISLNLLLLNFSISLMVT
uniref:NADH dehydrogenase subunit 1 n=1 Tax=Aeolothrips xinjiangensis TaxID=2942826 RepID=UPI0020286FDB|nr:NADH dehydrogenase subunit 1 [Aeolothrips xinjiangensis]UQJ77467.1 NADH dehydrogenase subunit 1 [Aeolothrips xinjiangensis]